MIECNSTAKKAEEKFLKKLIKKLLTMRIVSAKINYVAVARDSNKEP